MSLKYVSAYLMSALAGNSSPSAADVQKILGAVGADVDTTLLEKLIANMEGKSVSEVIAAGMSKLQSISVGSGAAAPAGGAAASAGAAPAAAEPEPEEDEEEDDMGFNLFED